MSKGGVWTEEGRCRIFRMLRKWYLEIYMSPNDWVLNLRLRKAESVIWMGSTENTQKFCEAVSVKPASRKTVGVGGCCQNIKSTLFSAKPLDMSIMFARIQFR
jgi:hypothetical protein